jgi:hypothetical protein
MADTDEITSQVEGFSQPHDNDKPSEFKSSESITQNVASVAPQGAVLSTPQPQVQSIYFQQLPLQEQQQQPQVLSSTQINASISGNASPQLFQVQQQPGQAPQTMALINGQLVPISATPVHVPVSGSAPVPLVLPQVQVQEQQTVVNIKASIVQRQPTVENSTSESTHKNKKASEGNLEKSELSSAQIVSASIKDAVAPPSTTKQSQPNTHANPATKETRNRGCGCGFWAAIMKSFQQKSQPQRNDDDDMNNKVDNQITTANNDAQNDNTTNQSLGNTVVNMAVQAVNPAPAPTPNQNLSASGVGQNTTANYYTLGANDLNNQGINANPTIMMTPDTGQYAVPAQQPSSIIDFSQAVPASDPGQTTNQVTADGTNDDDGDIDEEAEEDLVDDGYDDDADDMDY